jgi:hypothetical protein
MQFIKELYRKLFNDLFSAATPPRIAVLDPTARLGASWCKHPEAPAMLAGQRRWGNKEIAMRCALAEETSLLAIGVNAKLDGNPPEK